MPTCCSWEVWIIQEYEISGQSTCRLTAPSPANTLAGDSQQAAQLSPRAATPAECHDRKNQYQKLNRRTNGAHISRCGRKICLCDFCPELAYAVCKHFVRRQGNRQARGRPLVSSRPQRLICSTRRPYIPSAVPADRSRIADT